MANQTIPITLQAGPVPPDFSAANINQLMQAIATYISGSIRADVSFYLETLNDPATFITNLIFNTTQRVFKAWDPSVGRYVPLTQFAFGDVKNSVVGVDTLATGWVVLDGREITAIPGLTAAQAVVLNTFFPTGFLPVVSPQNIAGLPPNGAFSGLPIGATYSQSEMEAIRDKDEELLVALNNNTTPPLYALIFAGYS